MKLNTLLNNLFKNVKAIARQQLNKKDHASTISKIGGGAVLAGLVSMLLGKHGGEKLAKFGSLATLASLAYQAYEKHKAEKNKGVFEAEFEHIEDTPENNQANLAIFKTMVAAAAADDEISDEEKQQIYAKANPNPELKQWLEAEFEQPASLTEIAELVGSDTNLASQAYLAARMICKKLSHKEVIFLARLAQALNLEQELVDALEQQAEEIEQTQNETKTTEI